MKYKHIKKQTEYVRKQFHSLNAFSIKQTNI